MARALIVGCGCRGRLLGGGLLAAGWAVRGTSRREEGATLIEQAGIEPAVADPARPDTVLDLVADVTVVAWMLGSAAGRAEDVAAIHGPCLERLLERLVETPVRGFVYEAVGSVDEAVLARGNEVLQAAAETWRIPSASILVDPQDSATWLDPYEVWTEAAVRGTIDLAFGRR